MTKTAGHSFTFPCQPWVTERDDNGTIQRMVPIPGTWTPAPKEYQDKGIKGIIAFPECRHSAFVGHDQGVNDNGARIIDGFQCPSCFRVFNARLQEWDTRKLFCVAWETTSVVNGEYVVHPHTYYTHAIDIAEAEFYFRETHKGRYNLVGIAPVIGYFGSEKNQTNLTV